MSSVLYKYHLLEVCGGTDQNIREESGYALGKERESRLANQETPLLVGACMVVLSCLCALPADSSHTFSTVPEERRWQIVMKALNPTVLTSLIFYCLYLLQSRVGGGNSL